MSKKCPYCNEEMELGYIQCRDGISWCRKKIKIAALSTLCSSSMVLSSSDGPFSGGAVKAYNCLKCKKIIIDYFDKQ